MTTWELKTWPEYFQPIRAGEKTFEVRVCEDKNFAAGDKLLLREYVSGVGYTGEVLSVIVTYVLPGGVFGIEGEYCVMSIAPLETARLIDQIQELNSQIAILEYNAGEGERCHSQVITDATFPLEQKIEKQAQGIIQLRETLAKFADDGTIGANWAKVALENTEGLLNDH